MKKIILYILFLCFIPIDVFAKSEEVTFSKCVDGDTAKFIINNEEYTARFLAVDTPEVKHPKKGVEPFGKEASNYTCNTLKKAKKIVLEYDDNSTKEDKYGRRLVWVFVDGKLLQKELISKGYAKVAYLYDDYKYTNDLKKEEKKAKTNKVGLWSNSNNKSNTNNEDNSLLNEILDKIFEYIIKEIESMI